RARGAAERLSGFHLVRARAPGARRRPRREGERRRIGRVFRHAPGRRAPLRLGLAAERAREGSPDPREIDAGGEDPPWRGAAAAAELGRLSPPSRGNRVLAGPRRPAARPAALRALGRRMEDRAACALAAL